MTTPERLYIFILEGKIGFQDEIGFVTGVSRKRKFLSPVNLSDAVLAMQILTKKDTSGKTVSIAADVNSDGKISLNEILYILQKAAEMR